MKIIDKLNCPADYNCGYCINWINQWERICKKGHLKEIIMNGTRRIYCKKNQDEKILCEDFTLQSP